MSDSVKCQCPKHVDLTKDFVMRFGFNHTFDEMDSSLRGDGPMIAVFGGRQVIYKENQS